MLVDGERCDHMVYVEQILGALGKIALCVSSCINHIRLLYAEVNHEGVGFAGSNRCGIEEIDKAGVAKADADASHGGGVLVTHRFDLSYSEKRIGRVGRVGLLRH